MAFAALELRHAPVLFAICQDYSKRRKLIIMEKLNGFVSLAEILNNDEAFDEDLRNAVLRETARIFKEEVHAKGYQHNDLQSGNVTVFVEDETYTFEVKID